MNTFEAIRARKSVRTYQDKPVEIEKITAVVEAGNMAAGTPMAGRAYFHVISSPEILRQVASGTKAVMQQSGVEMLVKLSSDPSYNPLYNAPVAVVISVERANDPNTQSMATANAACAGENMLLAATELGLGSCYLMSPTMAFNIPEVRAAVKLPESVQPVALIIFGYTDDTAPHAERLENPDNIIYIASGRQ